jgi:hypothetical protein
VGQRPFDMGYKSMFVLQDLVNKKAVADPIYTGSTFAGRRRRPPASK